MKMNYFFQSLFIAGVALMFTGCSKNISGLNWDPVEVKSVEAEADFDLSTRQDWELLVNEVPYDVTVNGKTVKGVAGEEIFMAWYIQMYAQLVFQYPGSREHIDADRELKIKSQDTWERLLMYDSLTGADMNSATENITGIKLIRTDAFLKFTVEGLPENAKVYLTERNDFTVYPYCNDGELMLCQAIVSAANTRNSMVLCITVGDRTYQQIIDLNKVEEVKSRSTRNIERNYLEQTQLTFDAKVETKQIDNEDTLVISIENLKASLDGKWSIEKY